ncbi:MAG TPA: flagellar biosynthetic protein FliR [Burkholderiales bacterium]|nr:flagellar biosynthetic protein FliR [Burkholderiales bacterium]
MIQITSAQLNALLAAFAFPMARILALVSTAPIFGNRGVPRRTRLLVGLAIGIVVAPLAGPIPDVSPSSYEGLAVLLQQIIIGTAMGMAMRVAFAAVDTAGEVIGLQMGLGFATFFDPQRGNNAPVVAQLLGLLAILFFLALNGHLLMISTLAESFTTLPVGADLFGPRAAYNIVTWGGQMFAAGFTLALPVVAALLITNLALGVLTRAAPQLNIFAVGFPITLLLGFFMLALVLPHLTGPMEKLLLSGVSAALDILRK